MKARSLILQGYQSSSSSCEDDDDTDSSVCDDTQDQTILEPKKPPVEALQAILGPKERRLPSPTAENVAKKPRLALPKCFQIPASAESKCLDGRVRTFKHVDGNWPSHIYVKVAPSDPLDDMQDISERAISKLSDALKDGPQGRCLHPIKSSDFHISLSRPFVLREHHIKPFLVGLRKHLATVRRFNYTLGGERLLSNDDGTRSFASVLVAEGAPQFRCLIDILNHLLKEFRQRPYYKDAIPHTSVAWCLGAISGDVLKQKRAKPHSVSKEKTSVEMCAAEMNNVLFCANEVHCKIGNKIWHVRLA